VTKIKDALIDVFLFLLIMGGFFSLLFFGAFVVNPIFLEWVESFTFGPDPVETSVTLRQFLVKFICMAIYCSFWLAVGLSAFCGLMALADRGLKKSWEEYKRGKYDPSLDEDFF